MFYAEVHCQAVSIVHGHSVRAVSGLRLHDVSVRVLQGIVGKRQGRWAAIPFGSLGSTEVG